MSPRNLRRLLVFSLSLNFAVVGVVAYHHVWPGHTGKHYGHGHHGKRWSQQLNLNAQQQATFTRLEQEFDTRKQHAHGEMAELRQQLKQELSESVPSRPSIDELLTKMSGEQARLQSHFVDLMFSMQAVLGPEDAQRFRQVLERHLISGHHRRAHSSH